MLLHGWFPGCFDVLLSVKSLLFFSVCSKKMRDLLCTVPNDFMLWNYRVIPVPPHIELEEQDDG